jgi:hypothetical protein
MATRADRLKRIVRLQRQIEALHETKRANHLSQAAAARQETTELVESLNASSPLPGLFPDIYNRRIGSSIEREDRENRNADAEAQKLANATARVKIVEKAWKEAARLEERDVADKERLEIVGRRLTEPK